MAQKAAQTESERAAAVEELLNDLETAIDRLKAMYEQYFLGIAKTAPAFLHNDVERQIRDLTQANIRQTRLRYKFVTLNQKFGSYNAYWRRTLREIEGGKYIRNLQKIGRAAARSGEEIPEEILAAMPKRMREQVIRDREAAIAQAKRRGKLPGAPGEFVSEDSTQEDALLELGGAPPELDDDFAAVISEPTGIRRNLVKPAPNRPHQLTKEDEDFDLDAFFAQVQSEPEPEPGPKFQPSVARATQPLPAQRSSAPVVTSSQPGRPPPLPRRSDPALPIPEAPLAPPPTGVARIQTRPLPPQVTGQPRPPAVPPGAPTLPLGAAVRPPATPPPRDATIPRSAQTMPGVGAPNKPLIPQPPGPQPSPVPAQPLPRMPGVPRAPASQTTRPLTIKPGSTDAHPIAPVQSVSSGAFKKAEAPPLRPPPGMSDADVNALHANYIKAKQLVGEDAGPGSRDKLLRTINAQAPKIMDQYKVGAVDFSVVVKDNQVIIRAKPKGKP